MSTRNNPWTERELRTLQKLVQMGYPSSVAAQRLGRSIPSVQRKAAEAGISFGQGKTGPR
jgi:hypothetical protein